MNKTLVLLVVLMVAIAASGQTNLPPCNANANPPVAPPNCTDYFGIANYASSPLPAGTIVGFTIVTSGAGYVSPVVDIQDPSGTGATATATSDANGVITSISVVTGGTGYIAPIITIYDSAANSTAAGATATATIGGPFTGGIRKFVDALAALPIAVPDTTTFPGSDYYVIALQDFMQKMHSDLPPTKVRGYVQLNAGTDANGQNTVPPKPFSYLGPLIVAQRNRPVRVLFKNLLPPGSAGNLYLPVDTTYMGAGLGPTGAPYTQNRATLHLHGGNTPWISDGTPHQWTTPAGEMSAGGQTRGVSTQFVPDMFFSTATGNLVPVPPCSATITTNCFPSALPAGVSNDPGAGNMTFYWTNQQGGRLMFYHDHSYGITRLNVYAGEAAGYLLYDPIEEAALSNATAPGTISSIPDLAHLVPLVIQDKTFVPSDTQLRSEDPTWINGKFGTTPGFTNMGDLWFPHVYPPNQNPSDADGVNAFGRWDYGPWFFPPQASLTAAGGALTFNCTSSAFPAIAPSTTPTPLDCPITPNPSGTPEAFMDTPVVNGVAYPVLHVAPAAYRLKVLNAANDRSWNLGLYIADASKKEVAVMPAVPPGAGTALPACSTPIPITSPNLAIGLASSVLDGNGNPVNGTGLPANCWPSSWPTDGRDGGVPDPRTAGPPFIQIGTEGGLLPNPVVIPSTPTDYEYGRRSVTVMNVSQHGLWLGPAERADVIVDFSRFANQTLILYNDAPAPAPAFDTRYDYYTADPDQSSTGGAPSTQPGYGPNTRTIMQIVVDGNAPNTQTFSLAALQAAFANGLFAQTQPTIVVPESTYNSAYKANFPNTYVKIQDNSITFTPIGSTTAPAPLTLQQKAIQELFTTDYGRMNATLGTELPFTSFLNQTTIPLGFIDPPTEIMKDGETQVWKLTHNGVDTHFIHFHLFNVQVLDRIGWDGTIRPPDANELGWKDTVRMNPLEDIALAIQPYKQTLPWPLPDSVRPMDVTAPPTPTTQFTNVNPFTNLPDAVTKNALTNFGWEYVWHCHILGHEENDMMRPIVFQVAPPAPSNMIGAWDPTTPGQVNLTWIDNSASETGFTVQRSTDPMFSPLTTTTLTTIPAKTGYGTAVTATDKPGAGMFFYRVRAVDDGFSMAAGYQDWNAGPALISGWSNIIELNTTPALATVSPSTVAFTTAQLVNTASTAQTITLSNGGGVPLAISAITIGGVNAADFTQTNNCGATLAAPTPPATAVSCSIAITFKPAATGVRAASLSISNSDPVNPILNVALTGTGVAPVAAITPTSQSWGSQIVGTVNANTTTLSNTGTAPLIVSSITIRGGNVSDFTQTNTCPIGGTTGLAAGANCTITVTFTPKAMGARSSVLVINSSDPVTPVLNSSLSGSGIEAIAGITPAALTFPLQLVNTTSTVQVLTLSNSGNMDMAITSIAIGGTNAFDFVSFNSCGAGGLKAPVPPATTTSCTISVTFSPTADGPRKATLTIATSALVPVGGTLTVPLNGTGTGVNVSTSALTFGAQVVGSTSQGQSVTLSNVGAVNIALGAMVFAGSNGADYSLNNNNCGGTLTPGTSCRITVRFSPTAAGVRTATLQMPTSDLGIPLATVSVTGTGLASAANLFPSTLDFGTVTLGQSNGPLPFTLSNTGNAPLIINSITIGGTDRNQFSFKSTCPIGGTGLPAPPAPNTCTIQVTFTPTNANTITKSANVTVNVAAPATAATANLTGSINVPIFTLSPTALAFGNQAIRTTSAAKPVTIANTGTATLIINGISVGGTDARQFAQSNTCGSGGFPAALAPGANCTVNVTFGPTSTGAKTAVLNVTAAAPATSQAVALSGTGQ